jgi:hypothetical protein
MQHVGPKLNTAGEKVSMDEDDLKSPLSETTKASMDSGSRDSAEFTHKPNDGLLELSEERDAESQRVVAPEHYVSTKAKLLFLAAYFFLNLFLTLSNKALLGKVRRTCRHTQLQGHLLIYRRLDTHGYSQLCTLPRPQ